MTELTKTKYKFGILVGFTYNIAYQIGFENSTGNTSYIVIFDKAVSMNEKYYPNPFKFDPNRFLNSDGSLKEKFSSQCQP